MGSAPVPQASTVNISKDVVTELGVAPIPEPGIILQIRTGKIGSSEDTSSAIDKHEHEGDSIYCGTTGLSGDEHFYRDHGGTERAIHQYNPNHYADWRAEEPPFPQLFDMGGFGENISSTNMTEANICVGDVFEVGTEGVLWQVSEPRSPCYKLDKRFQWSRALRRIQRTGRVGWIYRVLKTGHIRKGDTITLIKRPHPTWSLMNIQRVIKGKAVRNELLEECAALEVLTDKFRELARKRLARSPKTYTLVDAQDVTKRVKRLTFELKDALKLEQSKFEGPYPYAQIKFGPAGSISRSYSIVSGNLRRFSLGVALDDRSRGGSAYLHQHLKVGDGIEMLPGFSPPVAETDDHIPEHSTDANEKLVVILGGIGVTSILSAIKTWEANTLSYQIHYAVRDVEDAAFLNMLPPSKTTVYAKSRNERLIVKDLIPSPTSDSHFNTRIFCCGPARMMDACKARIEELHYPQHLVHLEDFGTAPSRNLGAPFEVEVHEPDTHRNETLRVSEEESLLEVLNEAGFDVMSSCRTGGCGACKVTLCGGEVDFKNRILNGRNREVALQSCVDRGIGKIQIEID